MPFHGYPKALVVSETTFLANIIYREEEGFFHNLLSRQDRADLETCSFRDLDSLCLDLRGPTGHTSDEEHKRVANGATQWHTVFVTPDLGAEIRMMKILEARKIRKESLCVQ